MTKRILSVILVLTVFFGGYALIPKKYNLLPVNEALCATHYGGVYKAKRTFTVTQYTTKYYPNGEIIRKKVTKKYREGSYYTVTRDGYDSVDGINLSGYLSSNFYLMYR